MEKGPDRPASVVRERGLVATMADGVGLVADVWHPPGPGRWPTLVQRLPYGRSVAAAPVLPSPIQLARLGYAVVVQDVRGRGESEGVFEPFRHEAADGVATIEWAAGLPWSTGDVVTYGYSYQGLNQLLAAAKRPPHLRGVAAMMCGAEAYEGWTYRGGCLQWSFVAAWTSQLMAQEPGAHPRAPDLDAIPLTAAFGEDPPEWFQDWLRHPDDDEYWAAFRPDLAAIEVPVFTVVGYFDQFAAATAAMAAATGATAVFGPWAHMPWGTRHGDLELGSHAGPAAAIDAFLGFVARVFRGVGHGHVRWFSLGQGWRVSPAWPPPAVRAKWSAVSNGNANSRHGDGRLVLGPAAGGPADVLVAEPLVPHPGDLAPLGTVAAAEDRRDVLCFTSDALAAPLDIAGTVVATVDAEADSPTYDLYVSLVAVDPSGECRHLSTGARRVRPGDPGPITLEIGPVAWFALEEFRVRVEVSASYFPAFDRNPHTTESPPAFATRTQCRVATITLFSLVLDFPTIIEGT